MHNLSISLDGYAAGPHQCRDHPLGIGGEHLHDWAFATRTFRRMHGMEGGGTGLDDDLAAQGNQGIGAGIMGRNMFGRSGDRGATSGGTAGGATPRPTTTRSSS